MSSIAFADQSIDVAPPRPLPRNRPPPAAPRAHRRGIRHGGRPLRALALVSALFLHALALFLIGQHPVEPLLVPAVLQASLIAPQPMPMAPPEPPKEVERVEPEPPKPIQRPQPKRKEVALPQLVAAADAPSPVSAPAQPPAPPEPVAIDAAPVAAPAPAPVAAPVLAPPPINPPRFNADYLQNPAPAYPALSRRMGEEGRVMLRVMVEADGLPSKVEIRTSSGFPRLDQAALEAVRKWKFVPARRGDEAVAAAVNVPLDFRFRD